jgi:hypothetical protein
VARGPITCLKFEAAASKCLANSEEVVDRAQRQLQHVGLPTACAVVCWQVSGAIADPHNVREWQAVLNAVARALAGVVPVYARNGNPSKPMPIAAADLLEGTFSSGAHQFITKSGKELHGLSIQRGDMLTAISVFKSAGITFAHRKLSS